MSKPAFSVEETRYGFRWGPADIQRCCSDPRGGVLLFVSAKAGKLEIRVTPKGQQVVAMFHPRGRK